MRVVEVCRLISFAFLLATFLLEVTSSCDMHVIFHAFLDTIAIRNFSVFF
jgi:hypothetical protein